MSSAAARTQGPFTYEALPPEEIKFVPLKQTQEFKANDLMQVRSACSCCLGGIVRRQPVCLARGHMSGVPMMWGYGRATLFILSTIRGPSF